MRVDQEDINFEQIITPTGLDSRISYKIPPPTPVEIIKEIRPELMLVDGYDNCIVGIVEDFDSTKVCYNTFLILEKLQQEGMSREEAIEYFDFNILGSYVGEYTPCFIEIL
jgi:hypothetical protein